MNLPASLHALAEHLTDSTAAALVRDAARVIERLPKTRDGEVVVPGATLFFADPDGDDDWFPRVAQVRVEMAIESLIYASPGFEDCYSTSAAAEQAAGEGLQK